jgi:hypothetical protein
LRFHTAWANTIRPDGAYGDYTLPIQQRRRDGLVLGHRISDLVNQAYGLTPEKIDLMWKTTPPRMPFSRP